MKLTRAQIVDGTGFEPGALFEQVTDFNGWSNRETWCAALWLNNDQGMTESVLESLRAWIEDMPDPDDSIHGATPYGAGDIIREYVEELFDWDQYGQEHGGERCVPAGLLSMATDIGSMYRVDWNEIGAAFLTDLREQDNDQ